MTRVLSLLALILASITILPAYAAPVGDALVHALCAMAGV